MSDTIPILHSQLSPSSPEQLRQDLQLELEPGGLPSPASLARLLREAGRRWGLCRRRELTTYLGRLLPACGFGEGSSERIKEVIEDLIALRDLEVLKAEGEGLIAPGLPRIVWCGEAGFVSGAVAELRLPLAPLEGAVGRAALVRWVRRTSEMEERLAGAGLRPWALIDWLGEPGYLGVARRRELEIGAVGELWTCLSAWFQETSLPTGNPSAYRVICGQPGEFFGSNRSGQARWRDATGAPDGLWCGARLGYTEEATTAALVQVADGIPVRVADLFDWEELKWALLGRGAAEGIRERIFLDEGAIQQTCALPQQLAGPLQALCVQEGWRWRALPGVAEGIAAAMREIGDLEVVDLSET